MMAEETSMIRVLDTETVNKIAAGEVVQRASNAIKELLENALDAGASQIHLVVDMTDPRCHSLSSFSVSDNGSGISRVDLPLAAQRHATSKLSQYSDLESIGTFGFRGEALASISMVSRLSILSRTRNSKVGYQLDYCNGQPTTNAVTPKPRMPGTTITVRDLFYNLPHRRLLRRGNNNTDAAANNNEYPRIVRLVQCYAIHYPHIGFHVEKKTKQNKTIVDLHTTATSPTSRMDVSTTVTTDTTHHNNHHHQQQQQPQQQVKLIAQLFGSGLQSQLLEISCEKFVSDLEAEQEEKKESSHSKQLLFSCHGFITNPSFDSSTTTTTSKPTSQLPSQSQTSKTTYQPLILFINHRLVDGCMKLRKTLEDVYATYAISSSSTRKPTFFYLSIAVPPETVDVNVHPTKREVTLLNFDAIATALATHTRNALEQNTTAKSFATATTATMPAVAITNPYSTKRPRPVADASVHPRNHNTKELINEDENNHHHNKNNSKPPSKRSFSTFTANNQAKNGNNNNTDDDDDDDKNQNIPNPPKKPTASSVIRTHWSTQAGALEPFVVPKKWITSSFSSNTQWTQSTATGGDKAQTQSSSNSSVSTAATTADDDSATGFANAQLPLTGSTEKQSLLSEESVEPFMHHSTCPLASESTLAALEVPGAFATAAARCTCRELPIRLPKNASEYSQLPETSSSSRRRSSLLFRRKKITPTECNYTSIQQLRKRITKHQSRELETKLRSACFVGVLSHHRCFVQCGDELVLLDHSSAAAELFYQLALFQFNGGCGMARLGGKVGLDVSTLIGMYVQFEEEESLGRISHNGNEQHEVEEKERNSTLESPSSAVAIQMSDTNQRLAQQAAACLLEHSEMIQEYFAIRIVREDETGVIRLQGLPDLLEGYEPSPHGIPLFLLRLATEVDWTEEKPCFDGICRELGKFYAQIPSHLDREEHIAWVRHTIFPAISSLLIPLERMKNKECITTTNLSKLYRVFERC
jgi:DNA mismatch repair protein MutL